ncbi:MAG: XRE family transcriptional regulator [Candidatus Altiarchaeota archaeon]|nr:XRE family transcriptional regulator [Candidatus Altiarchaeota archaeon]
MPKSVKVEVDPDVFKWLRISAGWTVEDVSKRLKTSSDVIGKVEGGKRNPTLRQLKELSQVFRRPIAAFLLSEPKKEKPMPKDYRMLPNKEDIFDKKTILVLRKARNLQEISEELSKNIDYQTKPKIERVNNSVNPKEIANNYRKKFDLTEEKQRKFKTAYNFFNYLRDVLEDMNILVFQFSMPLEDARGFVLVDELPNIIVVNTKDSIEARVFSLMHEFAHILLGESIIDLPDVSKIRKNKIEQWCDEFASSFLFPEEISKRLFESKNDVLTDSKTLRGLSRKYKLSKAMILVNMRKLHYISENEFEEVLNRYKPPEKKSKKKGGKQGGGIPSDKRCISQVGTKFVSIVANNYDHRHITYTDALNYLSIKSKNFDKVLAKARK